VLTPAELATLGPADLEDLARGRKPGVSTRKTPSRSRATVNREASPSKPRRSQRRSPGTDPAS
jgi:hypothetical protein